MFPRQVSPLSPFTSFTDLPNCAETHPLPSSLRHSNILANFRATGRTIPARDGQLREREREKGTRRIAGSENNDARPPSRQVVEKATKKYARRRRHHGECIREIRVCSFQLSPVFSYAPYEEGGSDRQPCVLYAMTKGEIWVGSSKCSGCLLYILSLSLSLSILPSLPPFNPSRTRNLRSCLRNKYKSTPSGGWSGAIADSNATVALSGKTRTAKSGGGGHRVPVYYLAGLQPAARLTSCFSS